MRLASLLFLSSGIMTTSSCVTTLDEYDLGKKPKAYINANIITMDDKNPKAEAIAIKDGKIIAIGSEEKVLASISKDDKVINLRGKTMIPGFVDGHSHFGGVSVQNNVANLLPRPDGDVNSIAELQNELRKFMDDSPIFKKYGTVIGFNYDDSQLVDKRHPTRHDLDKVTTEYPVIVMHQSGHLGVYNTKALEMAKVNSETINPPGGVIRREKDGKTPNGVLEETAHFMVFFRMLPQFDMEDIHAMYKNTEALYAANGFTTVQDGRTDMGTIQGLIASSKIEPFTVDVVSYADLQAIGDDPILNSKYMSSKYTRGFRFGGVKLSFDGSPQGKTAWFTEPYFVPPEGQEKNYRGYPAFEDAEAEKWMRMAYKKDWQILVHTNGDAAVDQLIRLVKKLRPVIGTKDHRTVLIHGQYLRKDQIPEVKKLKIFPSLYPMHTYYWGDWHRTSVAGPKRAENISPTGWVLKNNMRFSIHSDAPVTFPNSMRIIDSSVNRRTRSNYLLGKDQKISPTTALKAMTIWPSYQHFEEDRKGSLRVGKQADIVILSDDPTKVDPKELINLKVLETQNDGVVIYRK